MLAIRALHLPQSVPALVISPTFSTVSAPFFTASTTALRDTLNQPHTELKI